MKLNPFKRPRGVALYDPPRPGERVWEPLQLSRLFRGLLKWLKAIFVVMLVVAASVGGGNCYSNKSLSANDSKIEGQNAELRAGQRELRRTNRRLQAAVDEIKATRTEAQVNVCGQDYNAAVTAISTLANAAEKQAREFVNQVYGEQPPPEADRAKIDRFIAAERRVAEEAAVETNKLRDCSEQGRADFYSHVPAAVPCPNGGDGKGYCK